MAPAATMAGVVLCASDLPDADRQECASIVAELGGDCFWEDICQQTASYTRHPPGSKPGNKVTHRMRRDDCAAAIQAAGGGGQTAQVNMRWVRACQKAARGGASLLPAAHEFPFLAPGLWRRIQALDGLLLKITAQLAKDHTAPLHVPRAPFHTAYDIASAQQRRISTPKAVARASATCRAWRHAANSERIWEGICERSGLPLLKILKTAPGCQMTWRQLFVQRVAANRLPPPADVPAPARANYLIGLELFAIRADGTRTLLHASTVELAPSNHEDRLTLCQDSRTRLGGSLESSDILTPLVGNDSDLHASLLLIRKSDSKIFELADCMDVSNDYNDNGDYHNIVSESMTEIGTVHVNDGAGRTSWLPQDLEIRLALGDDSSGKARLRLTILEEAVKHCSNRDPPAYNWAPAVHFVCSCGHRTAPHDQAFQLREWELEVEGDPDVILGDDDVSGDEVLLDSVDALLQAVEGLGATSRWV